MSELTISVIDDAATFAAMRDEWNELLAASDADSIFLTWEWLHTWWKHCAHGRLFFIAVRARRQLVGIAPLMRTRSWAGEKLEFAGSGTIGSDYLDFIVRRGFEDRVMPMVSAFIADRGMTLRLIRMTTTAIAARETGDTLRRGSWQVVSTSAEVCPFIDLPADFESFLATLGSSHRYNYRRRLKNLQRDFDMKIERATTDEERRNALHTVIGLHLARWRARGGTDAFNSAAVFAFHEEFTQLALERGWLRMMVIRVNDRPAAALYGFRYGATYSFYQSGFEPALSKTSAGLVMIGLTIKDAIAEGATRYDFLHGDESYKFLWTKTVRQLVRLELYPPSRHGRRHLKAARMSSAARRFAKSVLGIAPPAAPAIEIQ
jgi:CelD/BcsL family acetyltransferase involved in cellulose biosynthesis